MCAIERDYSHFRKFKKGAESKNLHLKKKTPKRSGGALEIGQCAAAPHGARRQGRWTATGSAILDFNHPILDGLTMTTGGLNS